MSALAVLSTSALVFALAIDLVGAVLAASVYASMAASMAASTVMPMNLLSPLVNFLSSRVGDVLLLFVVGFSQKLAAIQTFPHNRYVVEDSTS